MDTDSLVAQLKIDEGVKKFPYTDTEGKITIGVGHNMTDNGLTDDEIDYILLNDIHNVTAELLVNFPWSLEMTDTRQQALANMCFNMGINTLLTFKNTLAHLEAGEYEQAADSMLKSKWASQVGQRATRIAEAIRNG